MAQQQQQRSATQRQDSNPLCGDIHQPLNNAQLRLGWKTGREHDYWIPAVDIDGEVPRELRGTLLRNGPGISEVYGNKLVHPIDGDGMVVALTFVDGKVHLRCRFVETKHRLHEQKEKKLLYKGQMGSNPNSAITESIRFLGNIVTLRWPKLQWRNPSNTNVFYWGGKVLSVYETGLPYCLDPYSMNTLGEDDIGGHIKMKSFGAHFRVDMINKTLVCMSVRPGVGSTKPSLYMYEFDENWRLVKEQHYNIEGLNYAHDFLLLPDYYVFHMTPFVDALPQDVLKVYMGLRGPGQLMRYHHHLPSRFVVVPRHKQAAHQDIMMIDTDPFHIYHFGTAQQTGDSIEFNAVCLGPKFNMEFEAGIWLSNASVAPGRMCCFTLDLKEKRCHSSHEPADPSSVEFPTTHPYRHGVSNCRYSYLMASDRKGYNLPYRDIVKFDAQCKNRQVWYSHGCVGEPVFVPRLGKQSWQEGAEDDGYVIAQLYVPQTHTTQFVVLDAQRVDQGPLATIKLKHHIPHGFHGTFTPDVFIGQETTPLITAKL